MFILLTDALTCPRCGPEFGLLVLADQMEDRRVIEGTLGCANCRSAYPIHNAAADLRPAPSASTDPAGSDGSDGSGGSGASGRLRGSGASGGSGGSGGSAESTESAESAESTESTESTDLTGSTRTAASTQSTGSTGSAAPTPDVSADEDAEAPVRLAALMGLAGATGLAMLAGPGARHAAAVSALVPDLEVVAVTDRPVGAEREPGVSRVAAGAVLPVRGGALRAAALTGGAGEALLREGLRVLAPGARLVVDGADARTAERLRALGAQVLLEQEGVVVARAPGRPVELRYNAVR